MRCCSPPLATRRAATLPLPAPAGRAQIYTPGPKPGERRRGMPQHGTLDRVLSANCLPIPRLLLAKRVARISGLGHCRTPRHEGCPHLLPQADRHRTLSAGRQRASLDLQKVSLEQKHE